MSPASRSKSKDKKANKETSKTPLKSSGPASAGSGIPGSAYNPQSKTFYTLDTVPTASATPISNGRFRNIDESDENLGGSLGAGAEYDSVSNNGSWSGESEDHKEKTSNPAARQEIIPGADNDKREKIRQKNEKKHQRQKERRAQELHERCRTYLMSRKLEQLAQQLVAMGFPQERATMALIMNEGKIEDSVVWLIEEAAEADKHKDRNLGGGGSLKLDISEELAHLAELEKRFKCTKQEVERAVVTAEGNLENAAETLRVMKQEPPSAPIKPEETGDPPNGGNSKVSVTASQNLAMRSQLKSNPPSTIQQRRDEKDFNYTKAAVTAVGSSQSLSKNVQSLKRIEPKMEWAKPQKTIVSTEKKWPPSGSNSSVTYSLASPPPTTKTEPRYFAGGSEMKSLQSTLREPVIMMQRPQSVTTKQVPATSVSSSPPPTAAGWYPPNGVEFMKSNGFPTHIPSTSLSSNNNMSSNQMYHQLQYQQQQQQHFAPSSSPAESPGNSRGNVSWSRVGAPPTFSAASSLGLFQGWGSAATSGTSSVVDWSTPGSRVYDYTRIDWSLDPLSRNPGGLWPGPASSVKNSVISDSDTNGVGANRTMRPAPPSANGSGVPIPGAKEGVVANGTTPSANGNGVPIPGVKEGVVANGSDPSAADGSREWTSPFEGNDLFTLPRQFVKSPFL